MKNNYILKILDTYWNFLLENIDFKQGINWRRLFYIFLLQLKGTIYGGELSLRGIVEVPLRTSFSGTISISCIHFRLKYFFFPAPERISLDTRQNKKFAYALSINLLFLPNTIRKYSTVRPYF